MDWYEFERDPAYIYTLLIMYTVATGVASVLLDSLLYWCCFCPAGVFVILVLLLSCWTVCYTGVVSVLLECLLYLYG